MTARPQSGITLIEMMVGLAVLALVLAIGVPSFSQMVANLRVRATSSSVLSGLQLARSEALKLNTNVTWRVDSTTGGKWSVILPDDSVRDTSASDSPASITVSSGDTEFIFNNLGQRTTPPANIGTVWIDIQNTHAGACEADGGSVRCLRVLIPVGGSVRLCDPRVSDDDARSCTL